MTKQRTQVLENRKWKTEHIFSSVEEWDLLFEKVGNAIDFSCFEGKLLSAETVKQCFDKLYSVSLDLERLAVYAYMRHDEDTRDDTFTALLQRVEVLEVKFAQKTSFITPELTALDESTLKSMVESPLLKDYDYELKSILKNKPHVLSKETEGVLSLGGQVFSGYRDIFKMIDNADLDFPKMELDGEEITITHGVYGVLMRDERQEVRKEAFQKYYEAYRKLLNTITSTYVGNVNKNVFITRARKHKSCLDRALFNEDVDTIVYENLIESVNDAVPTLHKYVELKKKALKLDTMHMYDIYASTVSEADLKLEYEEAFEVVKKGLKPLGEEYQKLLQQAFDGGWIDVEETAGKRSGAYSIGVYGIPHPYVLLNYQKTTNDIFTIAHELGHAIHTYFSNKNQPQSKADYRIFVAEVASTVNEVLLLRSMVDNTNDKKLKKYLLSYFADMIKGTLFRQTMFAEFEYIAHSKAEKGEPLTKDILNGIYLSLNEKYYGKAVVSDKEISWEWSRIPHFYNAFYVYKYSTGIISALSIANRILTEGKPAVQDYFKFLSSGGSDSPVTLLKIAGVDLTKKDAFKVAFETFSQILDEFDSIELD